MTFSALEESLQKSDSPVCASSSEMRSFIVFPGWECEPGAFFESFGGSSKTPPGIEDFGGKFRHGAIQFD
jgi:hypothetical protein